jgi:RNA polymerase sigma-70 factor (ECF subfamily)
MSGRGTIGSLGPVSNDDGVFAAERSRLVGLAYRMVGSVLDAEDIVQEAWIRWDRADRTVIERPAAWLTTVVSHLALDRLRARQREREDYVGPWLPEPVVEPDPPAEATDRPEQHAELADSLSTAFLVLLETLDPTERLVVLLADVFGERFSTIAGIVGRTEDATRQLAVRARRKLRREGEAIGDQRARPSGGEQRRLAEAFIAALVAGDQETLATIVAPDIVLVADGGADKPTARRPVVGRDRVLRVLHAGAKRFPRGVDLAWARINGSPGLIVRDGGAVLLALEVGISGSSVTAIRLHENPSKLRAVERRVALW